MSTVSLCAAPPRAFAAALACAVLFAPGARAQDAGAAAAVEEDAGTAPAGSDAGTASAAHEAGAASTGRDASAASAGHASAASGGRDAGTVPAPAEPGGAAARAQATREAQAAEAAKKADLDARLAKERATAAQLSQRESGILGKLAELERQIEIEGRSLRAAQARLRLSNARLSAVAARAKAAEDEVARSTLALGPRLTARYRLGREGYVRFLLGARSIADVLRRKRLFSALLERDFDALANLRFHAEGARAARNDLQKARDELAQSAATEQEKRKDLDARVQQQRHTLASVQQEKGAHEEALRELEEAARDLSRELSELSRKGGAPLAQQAAPPAGAGAQGSAPVSIGAVQLSGEPPIRSARGKLPFPVEAGRIEARFGRAVDPRFGTVTLQRGIDIRAPEGTKVHAIHGGKVVHAGWFRGYGNLMIIDHGGGMFSLMAHLATLDRARDDEVRRGDLLGAVGDTGSLKGSYLYFELRDGQKPLDPERWLSRMRKPAPMIAGDKSSR